MHYIAILDHQHLDHSFFMKSFAESMSKQKKSQAIILHGDSPYTDRLIQTGMIRSDALLRSTRDLNHRIITLLADNGISAIGINGYQKKIIQQEKNELLIQKEWFESRPPSTHIVLSNLVWCCHTNTVIPVPLVELANKLNEQFSQLPVVIFAKAETSGALSEKSEEKFDISRIQPEQASMSIPDDLKPVPRNGHLSTPETFEKLPDTSDLYTF